jgi:undecaprenyl-diphosphatase
MKLSFTSTKIVFFALGSLCALFFAIWTLLVRSDRLNQWDFDTTAKIQYLTPHRFDAYLEKLSTITNAYSISAVLAVLLLLLPRPWLTRIWVGSLFVGAHVVELIGKEVMHHPNPPNLFYRSSHIFDMPDDYIHPGSSYPSGHSLRVIFLSLIVLAWILGLPNTSRNIFLKITALGFFGVLSALTLVSRISLGEHWPSDVVGGVFLGGWIGWWSAMQIWKNHRSLSPAE